METEILTTLDPWLSQFPAPAQPLVLAWFGYAASQRPQTPDGLLTIVERLVSRKLEWSIEPSTRQVCSRVLLALCHQRSAALAYATTLLARTDAPAFGRFGT